MKKKGIRRVLIVLTLLAVLATSAYAYMIHTSQTVDNIFVPAQVSCKINETFTGSQKTSITVTNTGNTTVYVRIRLVYQWQDSKGNVVARDKPGVSFGINENWKAGGSQGSERYYTYYYKTPLAPNETTENLLTSAISLASVAEEYNHVNYVYHPVIEILAEAIQSNPESSAEEAWGISIENGTIQ